MYMYMHMYMLYTCIYYMYVTRDDWHLCVCDLKAFIFLWQALPSPYSAGKGFFATSQKILQFQEGHFRERKVSHVIV